MTCQVLSLFPHTHTSGASGTKRRQKLKKRKRKMALFSSSIENYLLTIAEKVITDLGKWNLSKEFFCSGKTFYGVENTSHS